MAGVSLAISRDENDIPNAPVAYREAPYSLQAYVKKKKNWVDSWQLCLKIPKKITDHEKNWCQVYN